MSVTGGVTGRAARRASRGVSRMGRLAGFAVVVFVGLLSASCSANYCDDLAQQVCACEGVNPRMCEQAELTATAAEEADDNGTRASNCRAELRDFCCDPYVY